LTLDASAAGVDELANQVLAHLSASKVLR